MNERLKNDYETISQAWQILKKYSEVKDRRSWWDALIDEISEFKSQGCFASELGTAILNTLDARNKSMKQYGDYSHDAEIAMEKLKAANHRQEEERKELKALRELNAGVRLYKDKRTGN